MNLLNTNFEEQKIGVRRLNLNKKKIAAEDGKVYNVGLKMESLNAHCLDHQAANIAPPSTQCDLPDGRLQTVRAPDKSPHIGAFPG